jgi:transposase
MNEGVQILLERMKTHPEEFVADMHQGSSKWGRAIQNLQEYLTKEDRQTLDTAWKQTVSEEMQRRFTEAVLLELIDPKVEKEQWGDSVLDAAGLTKQNIAQHKIFLAQQQAQAAQQAPGSITNIVGGAGQGLLGTWFGGNK